jgi:hypothetical protein
MYSSEILVFEFVFGGCPVAFIETNNNETTQLEWSIKVIANEIKTYPYLQVVPKGSEIDFKKIFPSFVQCQENLSNNCAQMKPQIDILSCQMVLL